MKNLIVMALGFIVSATAVAQEAETAAVISFQNGAIKAELTWLDSPPTAGPESKLQVQWLNAQSEAIELDGDFRVVLFMPDMGHGSSPTKIAKLDTAPGLYRVSKVYFTMPGLWEVRVTHRPANAAPETKALALII
ncbi:MAG: FixH family protein, partial [Pseudobdellovibrionaceae bacterium]